MKEIKLKGRENLNQELLSYRRKELKNMIRAKLREDKI
jgi:hypothetical protein